MATAQPGIHQRLYAFPAPAEWLLSEMLPKALGEIAHLARQITPPSRQPPHYAIKDSTEANG
jgi:hypothetical protein